MPSTPFDARDTKLSRAVDRVFGEKFTLNARKSSNDVDLPNVADASRPTFDAIGTFERPGKGTTPAARGATQDDNAHKWSASLPSASFDDAALIWRPTRGDRATRQFDGTAYEIERVSPDGFGRTTIYFTKAKA